MGADPDLRWYDVRGVRHDSLPVSQTDFHHARPIYETMDGWEDDISECRDFADLPKATQLYVQRLEELCRTRISGIGVGPERDQSIVIHDLI